MGPEILHALHAHPLVQPIMAELEHRGEGRIALACHSPAVWVEALRNDAGRYELVARIERPEWWVPKLDTREDHVQKLTTWLARRLRGQWDARRA